MNIAVVEDIPAERRALCAMVRDILRESGEAPRIMEFSGGAAFRKAFFPGRFDIIFLDIYLEKTTGMELARSVRETDPAAHIVFATITGEYAVQSYGVRAAYYLVKPLAREEVERALAVCVGESLRESRSVEVVVQRRLVRVRMSDILFAVKARNAVNLHTVGGCLKTYRTFARFAPSLLWDSRFLKCYHGCVVNMDHIAMAEETRFRMDNGALVQIHRHNAKAIKAAYHRYAAARGEVGGAHGEQGPP